MSTEESKGGEGKKEEFSFKGCEEMMKMMNQCMGGKGDKVNFEQFCGTMSDFCKKMMKGRVQS